MLELGRLLRLLPDRGPDRLESKTGPVNTLEEGVKIVKILICFVSLSQS